MLVVNPGAQGGLHFSMVAHPTDPDVVFLGGDAPVPDDGPGGLNPFASGYMSRYRVTMDDATPANDAWTPITDFNANGTRPHADARDAVFDSNGDLVEVDDGGIYRLVDPDSANRQWEPLNGNLRLTEFFSVAYDSLNDTLFGGTQDNGTPRQRATSDPLYPFTWTTAQGADGGVAGVDNDQDAHPDETWIYTVSQNLGGFTRRVIDNTNAQVNTAGLGVVAGTNGNTIQGVENAILNPNGTRGTLLYMTPYAVNAVAPTRLVVGTNFLYESTDSGSTFTAVGGLQDVNGDTLDNDNDGAVDEGDEFLPLNPVGKVNGIDPARPLSSPIAYGGTADGADNADVLWLGAGGGLRLRTAGNGLPASVLNYTGGAVVDVVMDPEDWHTAFILDANGSVFQAVTNDAGTNVTFTDVTGDLGQLATSLRVLEAVRVDGKLVLLAGGRLGVYRAVNPSAGSLWAEFGGNLPNAPVNDIRYDATDDVLLVGTFGRGAWTIDNASLVLPQNPVLNICGDEDQVNQDDVFRLVRNAGNPLLLDVFINSVLSFTGPLAAIGQINVFGGGGNDNLIVDSTNGLINTAGGIRYDGDGKCPDEVSPGDGAGYDRGFDRLTLLQDGGPIQSSSTYWMGPQIGSGIYTIVGGGPGDTQTVFFEELEPVIDLVPAVTHTINATPENNAIDYAAGPNSGIISLLNPAGDITAQVTVDNYEADEFANKTNVVINALAGDDVININLVPTPTGLSGTVAIDAGAPGGSDTLVVTGTAAAEAFEYAPNAPDGGTLVLPGPDVVFSQIAAVVIDGRSDLNDDSLTVRSESGVDYVVLEPGTAFDSGTVQIRSSAGAESTPPLTFRALGEDAWVSFASGAPNAREDVLEYLGTNTSDAFAVTAANGGTVLLNQQLEVRFPGAAELVLHGLHSDDTFNVLPMAGVAIRVDGGDPSASDTLNFERAVAGAATVVVNLDAVPGGPSFVQTIEQPGLGIVTLAGIETANLDANTADLFFSGTRVDDEITFTPTSGDSGSLTARGIATRFNFDEVPSGNALRITGGGTGLGGPPGGGFSDKVIFEGTTGSDRIRVNSPTRFVQLVIQGFGFPPPILATWRGVTLDDSTSPFGTPGVIETVEVRGRDGDDTFHVVPGDSIGNGLFVNIDGGSPHASDALVITDLDGANNPIPLAASDFVVDSKSLVAGAGQIIVFQSAVRRPGIAYQDVEVVSPNVFVNAAGDPNLLVLGPDPFEENEFRTTAAFLGSGHTINVQDLAVFPNASEHVGVPADQDWFRVVAQTTGTLDFQVYFRQFAPALLPAGGDLDIEVRDEAGNVMAGFGINDATDNERIRIPAVAGRTYYLRVFGADGNVVNGYDVTVVNQAPPVPYDLELLDNPPGDPPPANSDTGRSQFDNITRDNTPTLVFRLDDGIFLHDLPGNSVNGAPPDEVIPIPFRSGPAQPVLPGFAIAIFDEGSSPPPGTQLGTPPQTPLGFASATGQEGVYQFTVPAGSPLADGSHFLTARVQMIDPSVSQQTGFGGRSQSLEIVVDTVPPPVFFGSAADPADGLTPDPGVTPQPPTFVDNKTNDRTPTFWGTAEADAIIRVWADLTPDNGADNFDVLLGLTVAEPLDGTNQFPNGQWRVTSTVDLNDPAFFPLDGLRRILVTAEDPAGNTAPLAGIAAEVLEIFVDTQGPQVFGVFFPRDPTLVGVGRGNNTLVRFQASDPGTILATVPMVGLAAGEIVVGIDVRPATGQLYAVADGPVTDRLYTVDPFTGAATFVANLTTPLSGTSFGVDFNPVVDRLRVVSDADQNLRIHPDTGNVTVDAALNPANPNVVAAAYTNSTAGAGATALYGIDSGTDNLVLQNPANAGTLAVIGALGVNATDVAGFEIAVEANVAYAALRVGAATQLYTIDLATGAALAVGPIGGNPLLDGVTSLPPYDVFDPKPSVDGPTPLVHQILIHIQDLPPRVVQFPNPALNPIVAVDPGHFLVVGDANGIIPIQTVTFTADPFVAGQPASGTLTLTFYKPLPDDRFTLSLNDSLVDDVGNSLDGESNADEPHEIPLFPSGDGQPGGDFVARFTVDSRPELGTYHSGSVWIDTNGNFGFDQDNLDYTNRDIVYMLGFTTDNLFAGNFSNPTVAPVLADGFDKLAGYGRVGSHFRWLIDFDNDGVPEDLDGDNVVGHIDPLGINGLPVAGNFDGNAANGDEVGLLAGSTWYFDMNHNYRLGDPMDIVFAGPLTGLPIVGDFDGDGLDDLGTWKDDQFTFLLATGVGTWGGPVQTLTFGFIGVREKPVAADMDQDGIDDVGLWVPDRAGVSPVEAGEWYFLVSAGETIPQRIAAENGVAQFEPVPFGHDLFASFGDEFAVPLVGNFDPPVTPTAGGAWSVGGTNPDEARDVNGDGLVTLS
jgi:hypothetical protein